ncbi:MAG: phosphotransferase family protein [Nevskia sp.]|nr:phosphotransferase family protein [Nevskia sp.]
MRRRFGASAAIDKLSVPSLGGSNRTVVFDLVEGAARRRLVSRQETLVTDHSPFLPPADQFRTMQAVYRHGFPVPEPVFEYDAADGMGAGFVSAFVEGETFPKALVESEQFAAVRPRLLVQFGELLAQLHSLPPAEFGFLRQWPDSVDALQAQRRRIDHYGEPHPALELALRWLERHRPPPAPAPAVFLHGDFRIGNIMAGPRGVTAVLDWECSHLGAPLEDLGWLSTRSWRFGRPQLPVGGIGPWQPFLDAYRGAGGGHADPESIRYWQVFGLMRWTVLNIMQAFEHVHRGRRGPVFAACGRNTALIEYELLMTLAGRYD